MGAFFCAGKCLIREKFYFKFMYWGVLMEKWKKFNWLLLTMMLALITALPPVASAGGGPVLNGFYAIQSYDHMEQIKGLDTVTFGWGRITYNSEKQVVFTTGGSLGTYDSFQEYRLPQGHQDVLSYTKRVNPWAKKYLQVFAVEQGVINELVNLNNAQLIEQVVKPMMDAIDQLGFDGVVIDIEGLKEQNGKTVAEKFNNLLSVIDSQLGSKELIVAVPPLTINGVAQGYAYDYQYIGRVADSVILMAHDYQHSANGVISIAASAPYYLVKEAVEQAVQPGAIPPEKLLLQVSLSVEQWRQTSGEYQFYAPSTNQLKDALAGKGGQVLQVTPADERHVVRYRDGSLYNVGYAYLQREQNNAVVVDEIYYEHSPSVLSKLNLAAQYNLKGLSVWRLGLGDDVLWQDINRYMGANQNAWVYGVTGIEGHWAEQDILALATRGVFANQEDKLIQPDTAITRGQFAHFLVQALGLKSAPSQSFKDLGAGDRYFASIAAANDASIVTGFPDGTVRANELVNREQMAAMMMRAYRHMGLTLPAAKELPFQDKLAVSDFAREAVSQAVELGIIKGYADHSFKPKEHTSQAQSLVMINRMVKLMDKK